MTIVENEGNTILLGGLHEFAGNVAAEYAKGPDTVLNGRAILQQRLELEQTRETNRAPAPRDAPMIEPGRETGIEMR